VLDRFYRGEQATGQGSGLGLAIVSRIAGRHHATLSLGNVSPQGGLSVKLSGLRAVEPATST
jgi:two-component system OmpR family sensor kinase